MPLQHRKSEDADVVARKHQLARVLVSPRVLVAVVCIGVLLRAILYYTNRSLTIDEAFVGLNIERRSAGELVGQLDWNTAAPVGFLEIEKAMVSALGGAEHVLRAAPFVASLLGLIVFVRLAGRVAQPQAAPLAVLMFGILALPIAYATLAKPYSFDVLVVEGLTLTTLTALSAPSNSWALAGLAVLGVLAPAFSYASVFAVAASAATLLAAALVRGTRAARVKMVAVVAGWATLFVAGYLWHGESISHIRHSFSGGSEYLGSVTSIRAALGAARITLGLSPSSAQLGTTFAVIASTVAFVFFVFGVVQLVRRGSQTAAVLLLPGLFAAVASAAHLYPLTPRTILFLTPTLVLCIAMGVVAVVERARGALLWPAVIALTGVVIVSASAATVHALAPLRRDDGMKPIMKVLSQRERPTDTLYVGFAAQYQLAYYLECGCATPSVERAQRRLWDVISVPGTVDQWSPALRSRSRRIILGSFHEYSLSNYDDIGTLQKRGRVWIIVSFLNRRQRETLVARFDRLGKQLAKFGQESGADSVTAYLYFF